MIGTFAVYCDLCRETMHRTSNPKLVESMDQDGWLTLPVPVVIRGRDLRAKPRSVTHVGPCCKAWFVKHSLGVP